MPKNGHTPFPLDQGDDHRKHVFFPTESRHTDLESTVTWVCPITCNGWQRRTSTTFHHPLKPGEPFSQTGCHVLSMLTAVLNAPFDHFAATPFSPVSRPPRRGWVGGGFLRGSAADALGGRMNTWICDAAHCDAPEVAKKEVLISSNQKEKQSRQCSAVLFSTGQSVQ